MTYTEAFKSKMVQRLLRPPTVSQGELSRRTGVPQATLSDWLREATVKDVSKKKRVLPAKELSDAPKVHSAEEKLRVLNEAANLSEQELGEFLRRDGLNSTSLDDWRQEALAGLRPAPQQPGRSGDAKRIKELERQLQRKDKALAEAAALLILQKKVQALWAVADDDTPPESDE